MLYKDYKKDKNISEFGFFKIETKGLAIIFIPAFFFVVFGIGIIAWSISEYYSDLNGGLFEPDFPIYDIITGSIMITCGLLMTLVFFIPFIIKHFPKYSETRIASYNNKFLFIPNGFKVYEINPYYIKNKNLVTKSKYAIAYIFYDDGNLKKRFKIRLTEYNETSQVITNIEANSQRNNRDMM